MDLTGTTGHVDAGATRTITWAAQREFATAAAALTGLEFLQAMARGDVPAAPMTQLIGMRLRSASEGETVFQLTPGEFHYNPTSVHGGVYATLLDSAAACAVHTTLPVGAAFQHPGPVRPPAQSHPSRHRTSHLHRPRGPCR
jgi:acyl-coenzyme A thioesterase PaaI-like protein